MKKIILTIALVLCMLYSLTGCKSGSTDGNTTNNGEDANTSTNVDVNDKEAIEDVVNEDNADNMKQDETETAKNADVKSDTEEPMNEEEAMLSRALLSKGNNYRLKQVIAKLQAGEDVTVAFIGGSITEGYNAGTKEIFAKVVSDYLADTYGTGDNVTYINAGLSGTPSMLGLIRADRDVVSFEPDLVFIEFAVNDANSITDKTAYESLIRKFLLQENDPAVLLLFSVTESGYTCQNDMGLTGFYYGLPMVSVNNVLKDEFEAGNMTWADWSNDEAHPNANGHKLYANMIKYVIDTLIKAGEDAKYTIPEERKYNKDWAQMKMFDHTNLELNETGSFETSSKHSAFPNGWSKVESDTTNNSMTFSFTGSTLFMVYKTVSTGNYGTADVYVDGELLMQLSALTSDGWNNPTTKLIFSEKEVADHVVEIRMQDGDEDKAFDLLALGICE